MSDELDLAAIEERCAKATPGPWNYIAPDTYCAQAIVTVGTVRPIPDQPGAVLGARELSFDDGDGFTDKQDCDNAIFVAHARTDLPACVEEIKRLRSEVESETRWADQYQREHETLRARVKELEEDSCTRKQADKVCPYITGAI